MFLVTNENMGLCLYMCNIDHRWWSKRCSAKEGKHLKKKKKKKYARVFKPKIAKSTLFWLIVAKMLIHVVGVVVGRRPLLTNSSGYLTWLYNNVTLDQTFWILFRCLPNSDFKNKLFYANPTNFGSSFWTRNCKISL